jgi:valyl-tRNA synthetase
MPFLTEAIWQNLRPHLPRPEAEALIAAPWPRANKRWQDSDAEQDVAGLQELVTGIRFWRRHLKRDPSEWIEVWVLPPYETHERVGKVTEYVEGIKDSSKRSLANALVQFDLQALEHCHDLLLHSRHVISALGRARPVNVRKFREDVPTEVWDNSSYVPGRFQLLIPRPTDVEAERARLRREVDDAQAEVALLEAKLANEQFRTRAPAAVVGKEEEKLAAARARLEGLQARLEELT